MFQFDSDFYRQCHADRVAGLRAAYARHPRTSHALAGQAVRRYLRRTWSRLRTASTRHVPALRA